MIEMAGDHPFIVKRQTAQLIHAQSEKFKIMLQKRKEEEMAAKRAKIAASKSQPNQILHNLMSTCQDGENDSMWKLPECEYDSGNNNNGVDILGMAFDALSLNYNYGHAVMQPPTQYEQAEQDYFSNYYNDASGEDSSGDDDDASLHIGHRKNVWFQHKKKLFDLVSAAYLESKNSQELIRKRKDEELAEKRAKVLASRQEKMLAVKKRKEIMTKKFNSEVENDDNMEHEKNNFDGSDQSLIESGDNVSDDDIDFDADDHHDMSSTQEEDLSYLLENCQQDDDESNTNYIAKMKEFQTEIQDTRLKVDALSSINLTRRVPKKFRDLRNEVHQQREARRFTFKSIQARKSEEARKIRLQGKKVKVQVRRARALELKKKREAANAVKDSLKKVNQLESKPSRWRRERAALKEQVGKMIQQRFAMLRETKTQKKL